MEVYDMDKRFTVYRCKCCREHIIKEDWESDDSLEETLWGHIQMDHEDIFEAVQDLDTPDMIRELYFETKVTWENYEEEKDPIQPITK
jgi:hypothetical protein